MKNSEFILNLDDRWNLIKYIKLEELLTQQDYFKDSLIIMSHNVDNLIEFNNFQVKFDIEDIYFINFDNYDQDFKKKKIFFLFLNKESKIIVDKLRHFAELYIVFFNTRKDMLDQEVVSLEIFKTSNFNLFK